MKNIEKFAQENGLTVKSVNYNFKNKTFVGYDLINKVNQICVSFEPWKDGTYKWLVKSDKVVFTNRITKQILSQINLNSEYKNLFAKNLI